MSKCRNSPRPLGRRAIPAILVLLSLVAAGCTSTSTADPVAPAPALTAGSSTAGGSNTGRSDPGSSDPGSSDPGSSDPGAGPDTASGDGSSATAGSSGTGISPSAGPDPSSAPVSAPDLSSGPNPSPAPAPVPTDFPAASSLPAPSSPAAPPAAELPDGGRTLFPGHLLVALYGQPGISGLGVLGQQDTAASIERIKELAAKYAPLSKSPVLPTFEVIATVASSGAGDDGNYSDESSIADLRKTVDAATAAGLYVVLDLQPGRTDFLTQARRYAELLRQPNVGLALDPEWRLKPGQRHLRQIGSVSTAEINETSAWLADLTAQAGLPQKLLLLHQFTLSMIKQESTLDVSHPELAVVIQMDGQGSPETKQSTWDAITEVAPAGIRFGWKNFYSKDTPMVSPADTMSKKPTPVLVSYE